MPSTTPILLAHKPMGVPTLHRMAMCLYVGMGSHMHGWARACMHQHSSSYLIAIPVSARCHWLSCHSAQPGWSSVHRARRTWNTWTTGPTRQGARRSKTPASFRSLPTATLVGTLPWSRTTLILFSSFSTLPSSCFCLSAVLCLASWCLSLSSSPSALFTFLWPFSLFLSSCSVFPSLAGLSLVSLPAPPHRVAFCDQH